MPDPMEGTLAANVHNPAFGPHEYKDPTASDDAEVETADVKPEGEVDGVETTPDDQGETEDVDEGPAYDSMLKAELEEMAADRGLEVEGGLKADLVAALEADDAAKDD